MRASHLQFLGLLSLVFLQTGGLWMGIKSLQALRLVQQEYRIQSNPSNAIQFGLSREAFDLYSIEGGKELEINGKMFDVVSIEFNDDSVRVLVLEDHFESRLIAVLIKTAHSNSKNPSQDAYLLALMHLQFIPPMDSSFELEPSVTSNNCRFKDLKQTIYSAFLQRPAQPPENKSKSDTPVFSFV
jgi:hypothetical protein